MRSAARTNSAVTRRDRCAERSTLWRSAAANASAGAGRLNPMKPADCTAMPNGARSRPSSSAAIGLRQMFPWHTTRMVFGRRRARRMSSAFRRRNGWSSRSGVRRTRNNRSAIAQGSRENTCGRSATTRPRRRRARGARGKKYTCHHGPVRALPARVRYLVTGGAGFIGSHLVERLVRDGAEVTVLDDLSTGRRENVRGVRHGIRFIRGNAARLEACRRAMQGVDYVLHHAAVTSVPHSTRNPLAAHHANVTATLNILLAAQEAKVRRVVFAGSTAAYGDATELPNHEGLLPRPLSEYAASKLSAEAYCQAFWRTHGLETVVLRYFHIFGPRQNLDSQYGAVIPLFIAAALRQQPPVIFGDGEQTRDFTFVTNVVEANLLACHAPAEQAVGAVFNIGCGTATSIRDLWWEIAELVGVDLEPLHEPARAGDVRHSMASIARAREQLGYNPVVSLQEGLQQTIAYYRERVAADRSDRQRMRAAPAAASPRLVHANLYPAA